tara:strand:- start:417 stop:593 length:177 start_codon:yes stop_codon:yes gene_type:complete
MAQTKVSPTISTIGVILKNSHESQKMRVLNPPAVANRCNVPLGKTSSNFFWPIFPPPN